jgi:ferredoxin
MKITRRIVQGSFLALTLIGVFVVRGNAERWCPFGGVEAIYSYWTEGNMVCSLGVTNFYVLAGLLITVLLIRRAFCGYLCPIGTISDWLGKLGKKIGLPTLRVPRMLDRVLSLAKYGVLAILLFLTWRASELMFRGFDPCYALISRHGEDITFWSYAVAGAIVVGSLFFSVPFCRWLCPLAAVMNPLSRIALTRVKRDSDTCIDCGKCSRACPMSIPVHEMQQVNVARCTSCLNCVASCPVSAKGALYWGAAGSGKRRWSQAVLVGVLIVAIGGVIVAANAFPLASFIQVREGAEAPPNAAILELGVEGVACRGSSSMLTYFLFRDDISEIPGYLKVETWPQQEGFARVRVTYDPDQTDGEAIKEAIVEPYYDELQSFERVSPFRIEGYAPWLP